MPFLFVSRCLSVLVVLIAVLWSQDLLGLVGTRGLMDPRIAESLAGLLPLSLFHWLPADSPLLDRALVILTDTVAISAAFLFWKPRSPWCAVALYLSFVCFKQTVGLLVYGVYEFLQVGLFYIAVANIAAHVFRRQGRESWRAERVVGTFFRMHLAMAYFFAGACKAVGPHWWTGESMWRALSRSDSTGQRWFDFAWTGQFPVLLQVLGITVFTLEMAYPLAFVPRLRPTIVAAMMALHLGTIIGQGLTLFGLAMIALNAFFWLESNESERPEPRLDSRPSEIAVGA